MQRLSFFFDEHVPEAFRTALDSNGFDVSRVSEELGQGTSDGEVLEWCHEERLVFVTNDRDFVEIGSETRHPGIIIYTTQTVSPGEFARAIRRIDRQYDVETLSDTMVWLEEWI